MSESAKLFDTSRRAAVALELAASDWWSIGTEGRGLSAISCEQPTDATPEFAYTWFTTTLSVDGERLSDVAVRKKGFLGSLSIVRPSLKLDLDDHVPRRELHALEKLTLNNNRQDGSCIRQCLSYWLFARAGVPAPRCGFAQVSVNGDDLGTYSNVESISKAFLRARFGSDTGNLYEGQGADFLSAKWSAFDAKTDTTVDTSDLDRLRTALQSEESQRLAAVEQVLDLDAFLTYWTMEALVADWDSYSTTSNNFYLYNDPKRGFRFIPWGTDATLNERALTGATRPQTISTNADLSRELWAIAEVRTRYIARMRQLLDKVWKVDEILAEVDKMVAVLPDADATEVEQIRAFVRNRRAVITAELDSGPKPSASNSPCFRMGAKVSGRFRGTWGGSAVAAMSGNEPLFEISVAGVAVPLTAVTAVGSSVKLMGPSGLGISLAGKKADGTNLSLQLQVEPGLFSARTVPLLGVTDIGLATGVPGTTNTGLDFQFLSEGTITFTEAGTQPGQPVAGSFEGTLYQIQL
ncbi:MAG TPA: CotH kinase family protein [Polyangiales bacterium]|nr:CotH kinase family protein [Polyangiales bacterium]